MSNANQLEIGDIFNTQGWFCIDSKDLESGALVLKQPIVYLAGVEAHGHPCHFSSATINNNQKDYDISLENTFFEITAIKGDFAELLECKDEGGLKAKLDLRAIVDMSKIANPA